MKGKKLPNCPSGLLTVFQLFRVLSAALFSVSPFGSFSPWGLWAKPRWKREGLSRSAEALHPITPKPGVLGALALRHPKSPAAEAAPLQGLDAISTGSHLA